LAKKLEPRVVYRTDDLTPPCHICAQRGDEWQICAIVDTTNLTDADWAEIDKGFSKALDELADRDPVQFLDIVTADFPHAVLEVIKDDIAANGFNDEKFYEIDAANDNPTTGKTGKQ
jgi:hypothetical protein